MNFKQLVIAISILCLIPIGGILYSIYNPYKPTDCEKEIRKVLKERNFRSYEKYKFEACGEKWHYYKNKGFRVWRVN